MSDETIEFLKEENKQLKKENEKLKREKDRLITAMVIMFGFTMLTLGITIARIIMGR